MSTPFAAETEEVQPSLEMLEFLLEWESADGQWHDPAESDPDVWKVREQDQETAAGTEAGT